MNALNYVHSIIKEFIIEIVQDEKDYELDESKMIDSSTTSKTELIELHGKELEILLEKLMKKILDSKNECPQNLRRLFSHTRKCSEKFEGMELKLIGGVFFLRLLNPGLNYYQKKFLIISSFLGFISPENYGILPEKPNKTVSRTLMLITKVLQNISNKVSMNFKEPYMSCMKDFTESKIEPIYKFLDEISDSKNVDEFIIENKQFTRQASTTNIGKFSKLLKSKNTTNNTSTPMPIPSTPTTTTSSSNTSSKPLKNPLSTISSSSQRKQSIREGNIEGSIKISDEMKLRCFHTLHKVFNSIFEKNAFKVPEVSENVILIEIKKKKNSI